MDMKMFALIIITIILALIVFLAAKRIFGLL